MDVGMGEVDDLFDLTASLFSKFWDMGWSTGLAILALILVTMLFAREVLVVEPDNIRLRIELFNLGIESSNPLKYISDLRYVEKPVALFKKCLSGSRLCRTFPCFHITG